MWNAGWMKHKLESSLPGKISITSDMQITPTLWPNHLRYAEDNTFMAESEELKSLMKKLKEESEKAGLKLSSKKIMASCPIISWQRLHFVSKITAECDWSHEIKRCLLLGRKAMRNLESILKSRDITLMAKVCIVKAVVFSVVMYECESWIM